MKNSIKSSRLLLTTAALLAIQTLPFGLQAQVAGTARAAGKPLEFIKIKMGELKMKVVGIDNGTPVFKNDKGEFFTVNQNTGDLNFIRPDQFAQFSYPIKIRPDMTASKTTPSVVHYPHPIKIELDKVTEVTIVGQDAQGHTLMKNSRGENFFIDPITGDLIFIKI
jgi:hypothetical protein